MDLRLSTINKINSMPQDLLFQVNDFIDFLQSKHQTASSEDDADNILSESGMDNYLINLNKYELLLAEGKIKW